MISFEQYIFGQIINKTNIEILYQSEFTKEVYDNTLLCISKYESQIDREYFEYLLKDRANPNFQDKYLKKTPLHFICQNRYNLSEEKIKIFLENKADANIKSKDGRLALHFLCGNINRTPEMVKTLVQQDKSSISAVDIDGDTPLHIACSSKIINNEIIKFLIEKEADVNLKNKKGSTPFGYYAKKKEKDVFIYQLFIINSKKKMSEKEISDLLYIECSRGAQLDVIKLLSKTKNAKKNEKSHKNELQELFFKLCSNPSAREYVLSYFIDLKVDIQAPNKNKNTPLHLVCRQNTLDIKKLEILLDLKADVNCKNKNGNTSFHLICKNNNFKNEILDLFLKDRVVDFFVENDEEMNPVTKLFNNPKVSRETVENFLRNHFLTQKLEISEKTKKMFHHFCDSNHIQSFELMKLMYKSLCDDPNFRFKKLNFLQLVSNSSNLTLSQLKFFCELKCDVNYTFDTHHPPIILLAKNYTSKYEHFEYLISEKCNLNTKDNLLEVFKFESRKNNRKEIMELFLKNGVNPNVIVSKKYRQENHSLLYYLRDSVDQFRTFIKYGADCNLDHHLILSLIEYGSDEVLFWSMVGGIYIETRYLTFIDKYEENSVKSLDKVFNNKIKYLIEYRDNRSLWNKDRHSSYPIHFKQKIFTVLLCNLVYPSQIKNPLLKIPKFLLQHIFYLSSIASNPNRKRNLDDSLEDSSENKRLKFDDLLDEINDDFFENSFDDIIV